MTKIKNFRLTLRPRDMARWLKKERGLDVTPELEVSLESLAKEGKRWITPAAVYTTLTRSIAEKTTTVEFPGKSMAVSVIAVSIGPALEAERQAAAADPGRDSLLAALEHEALTQAIQFCVRLIQDQAKEEECELSSVMSVHDLAPEHQGPTTQSSLAALVGVQRIGIQLDGEQTSLPTHVRMAWLFWTPLRKAAPRRSTAASSSAARLAGAEKAVA